MFVYKATNTVNGKVYVGKTIRANPGVRWSQHRDDAKNGYRKGRGRQYFAAALRKYGTIAFKFEVVDTAETAEELNHREIEWIAKLDSANRAKGYNLTLGGDRPKHAEHSKIRRRGYKRPPEVVAKVAASNRGKVIPLEVRLKMSLARKGVPVSPERAAAMKANPPGLGTKRTIEQKKRMSDGIKAAWTPELKERVSKIQKESRSKKPRAGHPMSEENKQKLIAASKAYWSSMTPEQRRERTKAAQSKAAAAACLPDNVKKRTESIRKAWTPEKRAEQAIIAREENHLKRINDWKERRVG